MKQNILFLIVTVISCLSSAWLYVLNGGAATEYRQLFDNFGVSTPRVTEMLFSFVHFWWLIAVAILLMSYAPMIMLKGRWKYVSLVTALTLLMGLIGVVYIPIFRMGSVV